MKAWQLGFGVAACLASLAAPAAVGEWTGEWPSGQRALTALTTRDGTLYSLLSPRHALRSKDGGRTWGRIRVETIDAPMRVVAVDSESKTIYMAGACGMIAQSVDGGRTFTHAGGPFDLPCGDINGLWVRGRTMLVATSAGIRRSDDAGRTFRQVVDHTTDYKDLTVCGDGGVYAATGRGVVKVDLRLATAQATSLTGVAVTAVKCDSVGKLFAVSGANLFRSTNGGANWATLSPAASLSRQTTPQIDAVVVDDTRVLAFFDQGFVAESADSGSTFRLLSGAVNGAGESAGLVLDPREPGYIMVGKRFAGGSFESTDRGHTFARQPCDGCTRITVAPLGATGGFFTSGYGGNWRSLDRGRSFSAMTGNGLAQEQFWRVTQSANTLVGATTNGTYVSNDGGESWLRRMSGLPQSIHGFTRVAAHPTQPGVLYQGYGGTLFRSSDMGLSWMPAGLTIGGDLVDITFAGSAIVVATNTSGVFLSVDNGESFESWNIGLDARRILLLAVSPVNPNRVWAASRSRVHHLDIAHRDAGWFNTSSGFFFDDHDPLALEFTSDGQTLHVAFNSQVSHMQYTLGVAETDPLGDADGDGIPNGVEVALGRDFAIKDNEVFGSARLFVMQMYRDFLGREGDPSGVDFWVDRIERKQRTRAQMAEEFVSSVEFQGRYAPALRTSFAINRAIPELSEVLARVRQRDAGQSVEAIGQSMYRASPRAAAYNAQADGNFIVGIYADLLGRLPSGAEHIAATQAIATVGRGGFIARIANTDEYSQRSGNQVYVTMMYMGMLRRAPEQAGFDFWVGAMNGGQSGLALVQAFLDASEFRARFLP